jgi:cellulose synthase (UDP-forming)
MSETMRATRHLRGAPPVPDWVATVFGDEEQRRRMRLGVIRILVVANVLLGAYYIAWRYAASINWAYWPFALMLLAAETFSFIDACLFSLTMWGLKDRGQPPPKRGDETVDVFITVYNEPVDLVRDTVRAAVAISHPHRTWVLDDGNSPEMRRMVEEEGAGYIVRTIEWQGRQRHAKAGNLNNAIFQTDGEFMMVLDADQVPLPDILDRMLGYFRDPKVAFVQSPQWFRNVPPGDPFGSEAPLFYGPILQGKDGHNAAFFCGSNAVLRREALMHGGIRDYTKNLEVRIRRALSTAERVLKQARRQVSGPDQARVAATIASLQHAVREAGGELKAGVPLQELTWSFQRKAEVAAREIVRDDLAAIRTELADIPGLDAGDDIEASLSALLDDESALQDLTRRESSPLAAIETVRHLLLAVDVDREDEAIPIMPMSTISVTEDLATAMRLYSVGWRSVYHNEVLAEGLAPEDLQTSLSQRLRWAQGNIQTMLRENPLTMKGLTWQQRLMYLATSWTYLSGFFALAYLLAPIGYLFFGWMPVKAFSSEFFGRLLPYLAINQLLFTVIGWRLRKFRGAQYSLALFPLWIRAMISAIGSVYFGKKLAFVVTSKTRQAGASLKLIRWQLVIMALLVVACLYGVTRMMLGIADDNASTLINIGWAVYDLVMLSVLIVAVRYRPADEESEPEPELVDAAATMRGRAAAGRA